MIFLSAISSRSFTLFGQLRLALPDVNRKIDNFEKTQRGTVGILSNTGSSLNFFFFFFTISLSILWYVTVIGRGDYS